MNRDRKGKRKIEEDLEKSRKRERLEGKKSSRSRSVSSESCSEHDFVLKTRKRDNSKDDNYRNESDDNKSQNSIECLKVNKKKRNQSSKNSGGTHFRSNLQTCIKELGDLHFSEEHLMTIRRMPFWLMFNAIYESNKNKLMKRCWKYEDNIREIILSFDRDVERFVVGRELISLKCRDVQLIFGLCGGDIDIPLKSVEYEISPWIRRCFRRKIDTLKSKLILYKNVIYKKLSEVLSMSDGTRIVDAARLTHLYLMAAVLAPNQNASISPHLAVYLEKLDDACRYDWCGYIVNMLLNQLKSTKNTKVGGCTILLPFWLCEHTNLVRPVNEVGFPRFLKWDLNDLEKQHKLLKLTDLEAKFVGPLKLKTSTR